MGGIWTTMKITLEADSAMNDPDFIFGVATSSSQIAGAADRRRPSIWDTFCARPGKIRDGSNADMACDHVARMEDDVDLMAELGVDAYRFSIAWPRVERSGGVLDEEGVGFYQRLLDRLALNDIKPFVTLYHWDLPQSIEDQGGWRNRETAYRFAEYTDRISRALGDRVFSWATLNEPLCSAYYGYETGMHAPGRTDALEARQAAHHLLLAHGLGMSVLQDRCPGALNGIVLNLSPCHPASDNEADRVAAWRADQYLNRWYLDPVLKGSYPELMNRLADGGRPDIRTGDLDIIAQPLDFLGVNYYSRGLFTAAGSGFEQVVPAGVPLTDMGWEIYPKGLEETLGSMLADYTLPPIYITENGAALPDERADGEFHDTGRVRYLQEHLAALDRAMRGGADVRGYFVWSLMDNFEWAEGYTRRFGLVHVDYPSQQRTIRTSGRSYQSMLAQRRRWAA
jgi:beta-glucosidase